MPTPLHFSSPHHLASVFPLLLALGIRPCFSFLPLETTALALSSLVRGPAIDESVSISLGQKISGCRFAAPPLQRWQLKPIIQLLYAEKGW